MNSTIPVNAAGLPSRRAALLGSLAGLGAAVALPTVGMAASAAADPVVAELAGLYAEAFARRCAASAALNQTEDLVVRHAFPDVLFEQDDDPLSRCFTPRWTGSRYWFGDDEQIAMLREWPIETMQKSQHHAGALARRADILAAYDGWQDATTASEQTAGLADANAAYGLAWAAEKAIRFRILDLRSTAPDVLRLKLRIFIDDVTSLDWRQEFDDHLQREIDEEGGPWQCAFAASIVRDLATAYMGGAS